MKYHKVFPRDLFNQANLLKSIGKITVKIIDNEIKGLDYNMEDRDESFDIQMNINDGSIYVNNLFFYDIESNPVEFFLPLNSRTNFGIIMVYKNGIYSPLDEDGNWVLEKYTFTKGGESG